MHSAVGRCFIGLAGLVLAASPSRADDAGKHGSVSIERVEMQPTHDGFYDATVNLAVHDPKLGSGGTVGFAVTIAHVHDVDEAITKVHDPVRLLGQDLQQGYIDIHREQQGSRAFWFSTCFIFRT